jgi:hypothetical protein
MLLALAAGPGWAAEADMYVVPARLQQGQIGAVQVVVRGDRPTAPPKVPVVPETGVDLRYDRQGQQVQIVNGVVSRQYEYVYRIEALEPGTYTIGPASVEVGTTTFRTDTARLVVEPRPTGPATTIDVEAGFGIEEAWVGQVVVYRRTIKSRLRILRDVWTDLPLDGLRAPRDGEAEYREYRVADPDGTIEVKEELHPKVLVEAGEREVPGAVARVAVASPDGRIDPFAMGRTQTEVLLTERKRLVVRDLPPPPAEFSGLVGDFLFEVALEPKRAGVGESVNLVVGVRGNGSLEGFDLPDLPEVAGARVYENGPAVAARIEGDGYLAEGRFSRVVVPTRTGTLDLPDLMLVTFSPSQGAYVHHNLELPPVQVTPGKGKVDGAVQSFTDTDQPEAEMVETPYEGVRDIRTAGSAFSWWLGDLLPWWIGLAAAPLIGLGGWDLGMATRRVLQAWRARAQQKPTSPLERLVHAPTEPQARLAACDSALREALALAAGTTPANLDRDAAIAQLPAPLGENVAALTRALDRARFGTGGGDSLWTEAHQVVQQLLEHSRKRR